MQRDTIGITDGGRPRSQLVELDGEHSLGVHAIVVFHPSQALTLRIRIILNNLVVGVGPEVTEVRNERIAGVVHTVVDVADHILLAHGRAVGQFH